MAGRAGIGVVGAIDGTYLEVVAALGKPRIGLRTGACAVGASVQGALKGGIGLVG